MKHSLLAAVLLAAAIASPAHAQSPSAANACPMLQFTGLQTGPGRLMIAAYGSAETYLKVPVWVKSLPVDQETMKVAMCDVPSSEIAVIAFQDLNGNGKLDSNPMGIPSEPYGASGTPAMFGAPTWNDTKVSIVGSLSPIIVKF